MTLKLILMLKNEKKIERNMKKKEKKKREKIHFIYSEGKDIQFHLKEN